MKQPITRIGFDMRDRSFYGNSYEYLPSIVIHRGGYGESKRYPFAKISAASVKRIQRITSTSGAIRVDNADMCMWYHNVDSIYTNGYKYYSDLLTFEVTRNWKLRISLTDAGVKEVNERLDNLEADIPTCNRSIMQLEQDLFEYALCNGWTLDPDDDGRWFISLDASIGDDGSFDVNPGDLGWSYNNYAVYFVGERLYNEGSVIFDCYYFGETSLEDQRPL